MSIEQVGPKKWKVRVQYRDPRTGRSRSLEKVVSGPRRAAADKEAELRGEAKRAGERKPRQKLRTYATSWIGSRQGSLKPSVARKYATSLDLHVLPALGDFFVDAIQPSDVQSYVADRTEAGAGGNTVLNELRLIRTIARDSVAEGAAARNWADRVKPPDVEGYTDDAPNMLTAAELAKMLSAVPPQWRLLVGMMAFTGLRWGEVSALRWGDINLHLREIRVSRGNWKGMEVLPKTKKSRRKVPIPEEMLAVLASEEQRATPGSLLFPARGRELHRGTPLRRVLSEACEKAGIPRVTPHGLRRTFNDLLRRVADKQVAKAIIGHVTDEMHGHYSRIDRAEKAEATKRVLELVSSGNAAGEPDVGGKGEQE
jgi:integrase